MIRIKQSRIIKMKRTTKQTLGGEQYTGCNQNLTVASDFPRMYIYFLLCCSYLSVYLYSQAVLHRDLLRILEPSLGTSVLFQCFSKRGKVEQLSLLNLFYINVFRKKMQVAFKQVIIIKTGLLLHSGGFQLATHMLKQGWAGQTQYTQQILSHYSRWTLLNLINYYIQCFLP